MKLIIVYIVLLVSLISCLNQTSVNQNKNQDTINTTTKFYHFDRYDLVRFGVLVSDSSILYNNKMFNLGTLNIVIMGDRYSVGTATTPQTNFDFYPRYITTVDTVQKYAYNLQGKGSNTVEEAQKWATFDKLIPIVVEQKYDSTVFGEPLVFWFTKTDSLIALLKKQ